MVNHDVSDPKQQPLPQGAAGMREGEFLRGKSPGFKGSDSQSVPDDQSSGSAGSRREVEWAGFGINSDKHVRIGGLSQL